MLSNPESPHQSAALSASVDVHVSVCEHHIAYEC